ncbi:MAG: leucine-rich repeat domain-containing protein [Oscillospiraceae bacterium]|nr:leucine-rich repeat domain-containing protein [Oscillospiraceae bacterium]
MSVTYSKSGKVLVKCTDEEETVIVPDGVTQIKAEAFLNCINLKEVILPESLKTIGVMAFRNCTSLERIKIPAGVRRVCRYTFLDCKNLEEIIFSDSLQSIQFSAFENCDSLKNVAIPDSVEDIDSYAFRNCSNLKELVYHNLHIRINFTDWYEFTYLQRTIRFINQRDYTEKIIASVKYDLLWQMFFQNPDDEKLKNYLHQYFSKIFLHLIEKDEAESVQKILDHYDFVTKNNIDKLIKYAIDHQKLQSQLLLMNYKASHNWQKERNLWL